MHTFMPARVFNKTAFLQNGQKYKVLVHEAPRRKKAYIQWCAAWFPQGGLLTALLSLPQCQAALSTISSTLAWVSYSPVSHRVSYKLQQYIKSTTITTSHVTQGAEEYEFTTHRRTEKGLNL